METGKILNLVMAWVEKGTELKVDVPVVFKGEVVCPGLKKGELCLLLSCSPNLFCCTVIVLLLPFLDGLW